MFYKVWNSETARYVMDNCKMCRSAAMRLANALELSTGDMHIVVPA